MEDEYKSKAPICKTCGVKTYLTSFYYLKNRRSRKNKSNCRLIYMCPQCHRYVNVHRGTNEPLGFPGDKELRIWRKFTHSVFDRLWQRNGNRNKTYQWLAKKLNIEFEECHIGNFDSKQCKKTIEICIKELARKPQN